MTSDRHFSGWLKKRLLATGTSVVILVCVAACTSDPDVAGTSAGTSGSSSSTLDQAAVTTSVSSDGEGVTTDSAQTQGSSAASELSVSVPEPATTEVPAPDGGDISQTVPAVEVSTQPAVDLTEQGDFGNGATVVVESVEQITAEAQGPGEIAGPAFQVTIRIDNATASAIDLSNVTVNLDDSAGTPASPMEGSPASPISGALAAGTAATGVYVFAIPVGLSEPISISVSYTTEAPIVLFVGSAQ